MNRIANAIEQKGNEIQAKIDAGTLAQEKVDGTHAALDMELDEYCSFQNLKSIASMDGGLTVTEAQTVYGYLGETPEHFNKQSIGVKVVLTMLHNELLGRKIKTMQAH